MADEANKWGIYGEALRADLQASRGISDEAMAAEYCRWNYQFAVAEFWYVLKEDEEFYRFYTEGEEGLKAPSGRKLTRDEMILVWSRAKAALSRQRRLWGYERLKQDGPGMRVLKAGR